MEKYYWVEFENGEQGFFGTYKTKKEAKQILGYNAGRNIKCILTKKELNNK